MKLFKSILLATSLSLSLGLTACDKSTDNQKINQETSQEVTQENTGNQENTSADDNTEQEATKQPADNESIVTVAISPTYQPFEYRNKSGDLVGFDIDLLATVAKKANIEIKYQPYSDFFDIINAVQTGKTDMAASAIFILPERKQLFDYSNSYFSMPLYFAGVKQGDYPKTLKDIKGKTISVQSNIIMEDIVDEKFVPMGNTKMAADTNFLAFRQILNGKADVMLDHIITIDDFSRHTEKNDHELFFIRLPDEYNLELGYAVTKNKPELLNKLNSSLKIIQENGEYAEIYNRWFGDIDKALLK